MSTSKHIPARILTTALLIPALLVALTGCTPTPDDEPYFDRIVTTPLEDAGFSRAGEPITSCGGNTPFCSQPAFEVYYQAPATLSAEQACAAFLTTAFNVATPVGYATTGDTAGPLPSDTRALQDFCVFGLANPMPQIDGTVFYQGTFLYDDGTADGLIKTFDLSRDPDGTYRSQLVFGRNPDLVHWNVDQNKVPTHLTREQVEQNNANVAVQVKTQEFANSLLQKTEAEAISIIEDAGYTYHVFQRNQTEHQATGSEPKRILLNIQNGIVQDAMAG
jgi:hypothetical protein